MNMGFLKILEINFRVKNYSREIVKENHQQMILNKINLTCLNFTENKNRMKISRAYLIIRK